MVGSKAACLVFLTLVCISCFAQQMPADWPLLEVALVRTVGEGETPAQLLLCRTGSPAADFIAYTDDNYPPRQYALGCGLLIYRNETEEGSGAPVYWMHGDRKAQADTVIDFKAGSQPDILALAPDAAYLAAGFEAAGKKESFVQYLAITGKEGVFTLAPAATLQTGGRRVSQFAWQPGNGLLAVNVLMQETPRRTALLYADPLGFRLQEAGADSRILGYGAGNTGFVLEQAGHYALLTPGGGVSPLSIGADLKLDIAMLRKEMIGYLPEADAWLVSVCGEDRDTPALYRIALADKKAKANKLLAAFPVRTSFLTTWDNRFCAFTTADCGLYAARLADGKVFRLYQASPGECQLTVKAIGYAKAQR